MVPRKLFVFYHITHIPCLLPFSSSPSFSLTLLYTYIYITYEYIYVCINNLSLSLSVFRIIRSYPSASPPYTPTSSDCDPVLLCPSLSSSLQWAPRSRTLYVNTHIHVSQVLCNTQKTKHTHTRTLYVYIYLLNIFIILFILILLIINFIILFFPYRDIVTYRHIPYLIRVYTFFSSIIPSIRIY